MKHRDGLACAFAATWILMSSGPALALNPSTHRIVNVQAAGRSNVDAVLKSDLGFTKGLDERIKGASVSDWLGEGGVREDDGIRFLRHFHDPLRPWDSAGLLFGVRWDSSIRWMQRPDQGWSWLGARLFYLAALTTATPAEREQAFADTFRALGQVMHLIVDASVPEHVRNDLHPKEGICRQFGLRCYGNYEYWVSDRQGRPGSPAEAKFIADFLSKHITLDETILQQSTGDPGAPAPIARLIDTKTYKGTTPTDPTVTLGPAIGIAEFANANFFSEDTGNVRLLGPNYPFPDRTRLVRTEHVSLRTGRPRAYYAKGAGDGLPVDPALAECALDEPASVDGVLEPRSYNCVDDNVWEKTATEMLPRAAVYARAALDHFFRGLLEVGFTEAPMDPAHVLLNVTNQSTEPLGPGTLTVYADDASGTRTPVGGATLTLTASVAKGELLPPLQLPASLRSSPLVVVYNGTLGGEAEAVIGRVVTPVTLEQVFRGASDWMLRTAEGVFPLGLGLGPELVKWGDRDNTLVTQTSLVGGDKVFAAFQINRPEGASEVPLGPDGRVDLIPLGSAALGGAPVDLGTTITLVRNTQASQKNVTLDAHVFSLTDVRFTGSTVQTFDLGAFPFSATFPLVLQLPDPAGNLYDWFFRDVSLNQAGEILATVQVILRHFGQTDIPCWFRLEDGQLVLAPRCQGAVHDFPFPAQMLFVVNLTRRSVVVKSAEDSVAISYTTKAELLTEDIHFISHTPDFVSTWQRVDSAGGPVTGPVVGEVAQSDGIVELTQSGFYRQELGAAGFTARTLVDLTSTDDLAIGRDATIRVTHTTRISCPNAIYLYDIGRSKGTNADYAVVGWRFCDDGSVNAWVPIRWSPGTAGVTRLAAIAASPEHSFNATLTSANRDAAMVVVDEFAPVTFDVLQVTHLVTAQEDLIFSGDLSGQYRLLEPGLLLNVATLRLHRISAGLEPLQGLRPLAPDGPTAGEYHVVGTKSPGRVATLP